MTAEPVPQPQGAALALYTSRACRDCGGPVLGRHVYCESDRARRRAKTFLRAAYQAAQPLGQRALVAIHEAEVALFAQGET